MDFVILLFLALLWAVSADDNAEQYQLRARELKPAGEMCIDFDRVGEVTVNVSGKYKWFLHHGATSYACKTPTTVKSNRIGERTFCRKINKKYHELRAPKFADKWLGEREWRGGSCLDEYGDDADVKITMSTRMKGEVSPSRRHRRSRFVTGRRDGRNRNRNGNKNRNRNQLNHGRNNKNPRRRRGDPRRRKRLFDRNRRRFDRNPRRRRGEPGNRRHFARNPRRWRGDPRKRKRRFDRNRRHFERNFENNFDNNQT